jgi:hypothetical protein
MESNDWIRIAALSPYEYTSYAFVIQAGKIKHIRAELSESSIAQINDLMRNLIPWAQENMPEVLHSLQGDGSFEFNSQNARHMMALLEAWRKAPRR